MTVMSELCAEPVAVTDGVPLGIAGYPGYRFVAQIAVATAGSLLGTFVLGSSKLGGPRWRDITGDIQGMSIDRGGEPAGRPIAGEITIRLHNPTGTWSPWVNPFYAPGTLLRIVIGNGVVTKPQFTGLVHSWNEAGVGLDAYEWIDIVAWEPQFLLAGIDDNALAVAVGAGETLTQRIDRLLAKAAWQFDRSIVSTLTATYQATDHAQDVASEMYRVVDSVEVTVWSGKDGRLRFRERRLGNGGAWTLAHQDKNPESLITANDDDRILASVDLARVGGSSVTYTNTGIAGRYQRRTSQRTDLVTVAEPANADLARVAAGMLARGRQTYRPQQFEVQSGQGPGPAALIFETELTDRVALDHHAVTFANYAICGFRHDVTVTKAGCYWITTITLDIEADSGWYEGLPTPSLVGYARVGRSRVGVSPAGLPTPALVGQARVAATRVGIT